MSYDPTTPAGKVRLLINDVAAPPNQVFGDDEIAAFLALEDNDVRYAAAQALDTIATNEALVLKVTKTMDLQTDGAKLADSLHRRAQALRAQADSDPDEAFVVIEFADPVFGERAARTRAAQRSAG